MALGNHDTSPTDQLGPPKASDYRNTPDEGLASQFDYHYDYLSKLWKYEGWLEDSASKMVRTHYGGYSVQRGRLRIISFNTDYCKSIHTITAGELIIVHVIRRVSVHRSQYFNILWLI